MIENAEHGGKPKEIKVKTQEGEKTLSVPLVDYEDIKSLSCGCLCTPERSASLLTTERS